MLLLDQCRYRYPDGPEVRLPSWEAATGERWAVLGPSGCGKSTLLQLLGGVRRPTGGRVAVAGQELSELGERQLDAFRARTIGMVFQTLQLIPALRVADNLRLARSLAGRAPDEARVHALLEALDIASIARAWPERISQGQAQRAALARALVTEPTVILADEPTAALDDANCSALLDVVLEQAARYEATLVVATHDQRVRARMDRVLEWPVEAAA